MENPIIILSGLSSAGKDEMLKLLQTKYQSIITSTTRPIRENEINGIHYSFITREEFETKIENNEVLEYREYNTLLNNVPDVWYYGTLKTSIPDAACVMVLDMLGVEAMKEAFPDRVISFFIDVDDKTRQERAKERGGYCDHEWNRRLEDDIAEFPQERIVRACDFIVQNYDKVKCYNDIINKLKTKGIE